MTDPATVGEIINQYEKHGWSLRRALLSDDSIPSLSDSLNGIDIISSDLEALWFSRSSRADSESWELRRLTGLPFALVAVIPSDASEEERETTLAQVADDMRDRTFA